MTGLGNELGEQLEVGGVDVTSGVQQRCAHVLKHTHSRGKQDAAESTQTPAKLHLRLEY